MRAFPFVFPSVLMLTLGVAGGLRAQTLTGRVVEEGSGHPVAGAFMVVLDEGGRARVAGLTSDRGGFRFRLDRPGRYRLRVDRIGYERVETEPFDVPAGSVVTRVVEAPTAAVDVGAVAVVGAGRCALRPEEGEPTWRLWSEARKALELTRWTESQRRLRFTVIRFERAMEPDSLVVGAETARLSVTLANRAFASDAPERLRELGYVRGDTREREYFLPDADVLLSEQFLDSHCFRAVGDAGDGLVGLAFEPLSPDMRSDVAGTLWLDRGTAELRTLDVRYVNPELPGRVDPERFGGQIDFRRLPDGAWVVARWRIRMPLFRPRGIFQRNAAIAHFEEVEAEVLGVESESGQPVPYARAGAVIVGSVRYPENGAPVVGAEVGLEGTPYRTTTDVRGRFLLEGLPAHRYRLTVEHPALERAPAPRLVTLARGDTLQLALGGSPP